MVQLVDIDTAKKHMGIEIDDDDEKLQIAIEQASSIILDYLKLDEDQAPDPVPGNIEAATLFAVEAIFDGTGDPLSDTVKNLLHRKRDPELA